MGNVASAQEEAPRGRDDLLSILYTYPEYVRPQMLQNQVLIWPYDNMAVWPRDCLNSRPESRPWPETGGAPYTTLPHRSPYRIKQCIPLTIYMRGVFSHLLQPSPTPGNLECLFLQYAFSCGQIIAFLILIDHLLFIIRIKFRFIPYQ